MANDPALTPAENRLMDELLSDLDKMPDDIGCKFVYNERNEVTRVNT